MEDFTEEDPGLGDPAALDELIWRLRRDQENLEKAHAAIRASAATIREHWKGKAGEAAAVAHDALTAGIEARHASVDRAVSACGAYQLAHDDVKESAAPWVTQLVEARHALGLANTTIGGAPGALGMDELIASATRSRAAALQEEAEALSHLATLYEARIDAQSRFRHSIAEITQTKRGSGITVRAISNPSPNGPPRRMQGPNEKDLRAIRDRIDRANATVWAMVDAWITGKGKRTFTFGESDAFTQVFIKSASVARAEADIQKKDLRGRIPLLRHREVRRTWRRPATRSQHDRELGHGRKPSRSLHRLLHIRLRGDQAERRRDRRRHHHRDERDHTGVRDPHSLD